ncbi:hypothetical protein EDB19DRAFT_1658481 [Suillus lakei]|nr:hypothetical protein EDB19DRAFT_1658481 [Suillus lakei]
MSNSQTSDARTALMQSILSHHLQAHPVGVSPSSLLRRPSRNFNAQDFVGHRKQAASPFKREARREGILLAIRGRTIYNSQADPATHSAHKTSSSRRAMKTTAPSCHPLGSGALLEGKLFFLDMEVEEENRKKDQGDFTPSYQAEDKSPWMGVPESDAHCRTPEWNGGSEQSPPSDMEYLPSRWNAPEFNSGEGDWEAMFDMYINEQEC